jgi:hypothetical protein
MHLRPEAATDIRRDDAQEMLREATVSAIHRLCMCGTWLAR